MKKERIIFQLKLYSRVLNNIYVDYKEKDILNAATRKVVKLFWNLFDLIDLYVRVILLYNTQHSKHQYTSLYFLHKKG